MQKNEPTSRYYAKLDPHTGATQQASANFTVEISEVFQCMVDNHNSTIITTTVHYDSATFPVIFGTTLQADNQGQTYEILPAVIATIYTDPSNPGLHYMLDSGYFSTELSIFTDYHTVKSGLGYYKDISIYACMNAKDRVCRLFSLKLSLTVRRCWPPG